MEKRTETCYGRLANLRVGIILLIIMLCISMFPFLTETGFAASSGTQTVELTGSKTISLKAGDDLYVKCDGWSSYTIKSPSGTVVKSGGSNSSKVEINDWVSTSQWVTGTYTLQYKRYKCSQIVRMVKSETGTGYMYTYERGAQTGSGTITIKCSGGNSSSGSTSGSSQTYSNVTGGDSTCSHTWGSAYDVEAKSCQERGRRERACTKCGAIALVNTLSYGDHDYQFYETTVEPTCTNTGYATYECRYCGDSITKVVAAKGHTYTANYVVEKEATCTTTGVQKIKCTVCGNVKSTQTIPAMGHTETTVVTPASTSDGRIIVMCLSCKEKFSETKIKGIKSVSFVGGDVITYTGENITPAVSVYDKSRNQLKEGTDYDVSYPEATSEVGEYTATVTFKGNYTGTQTINYTVIPQGTKFKSLKLKKKTITLKWYAQENADGYQIAYAKTYKFPESTTKYKTVKGSKNVTKTIKKLSSNKTYYFKVRTYKDTPQGRIYSNWSKYSSRKVKK